MSQASWGGRLPLVDTDDMTQQQRPLYERMLNKQVAWARRHNFTATTDDGQLIGPFNPLLYGPGTAAGFLDFEAAEDEHTSIGGRLRQVIILTVGAAFQAQYELYSHAALAREEGLPEAAVSALCTGEEVSEGLSGEEQLAHRCTRALVVERRLSAELYQTAEKQFGHSALVDIALLIGRYTVISTLLATFDVPAPDAR